MIRKYQTQKGLKWTATEATWDNERQGSIEKKIEPMALEALGFSLNMTPDQAKAHAKKLNALAAIERKDQSSKIKAAERLTDLITVENSIIPSDLSKAFISHIEENWYGGRYNLRKQILHWNTVQKILTKLKVQPHDYFKRQKDFYKYFQNEGYGKSSVEKLLKVINQWGEFYADQSRTYFKRIPNPKGIALEAINDASDADGKGATPLTTQMLMKMSGGKMPSGQFEYMRATLWLGLRPSELDLLISDSSKYKVTMQGKTKVLAVYQSKLTGVAKSKRWKYIPLFHKEMKASLEDLQNSRLSKPLVKTIKKALPKVEGVGLYSGRKGFTDLMLSLGQNLEDIASWLGHSSIERTWKHYKAKDVVNFVPIKKRRSS